MKSLVLAATLISCLAFAAEPAADAKPADNAMAGWKPKHVTKKDQKGIDQLYKEMDEIWKKGDLEAAAAHHDFPIFMLTDNAAGVTSGGEWNKEMYMQAMKPAMEGMPKDMKISHKFKVSWVTDSIAFVEETNTMTPPKGKSDTWTSASVLVLKDGKWMFKGGAEGGWGDMMPEKKAEAAPAAQPAKTAETKQPAGSTPTNTATKK
ncbi:MAG: nuclear transport factor 2 family protein [Archangiaceae bacterium]|nr:nuclear transport factor 2 family protein [Archangiaceae bacterium]